MHLSRSHVLFVNKTCVVFVLKYCCNNFVDKMATFHVDGQLRLTISVDEFGTTIVYEQCLCAMFGFQCDSLHTSKDVAYDSNNIVLIHCTRFPWRRHKENNGL